MNPTRLFKNGARYWFRLNSPSGERPRLSTGTDDKVRATRIATMIDELLEDRRSRHWIDMLEQGRVDASALYDRRARGQLEALAAELEGGADPDLSPMVDAWLAKLDKRSVSADTKADYRRQVRAIIPAGEVFPASAFTEDVLAERLSALVDKRSGEPLSGSTLARYVAPLRLFYRYARKQLPTLVNPFDDPDWLPANNPSRMKYWDHATVLQVLRRMTGEYRSAMALLFGTGIELGALLALKVGDVHVDGTITARGTKNNARRNRTVFLDDWAVLDVAVYASSRLIGEPLYHFQSDGGDLRDAFYAAQVAEGLVPEPPRSKGGKQLWSKVDIHTLHDCRHSYCYNRILGLDGEPRQSLKYCANQLGHTTEQMVMQVYGKTRMDDRIRQLEKEEAFTAGTRAQEGATA
jgi:integrase